MDHENSIPTDEQFDEIKKIRIQYKDCRKGNGYDNLEEGRAKKILLKSVANPNTKKISLDMYDSHKDGLRDLLNTFINLELTKYTSDDFFSNLFKRGETNPRELLSEYCPPSESGDAYEWAADANDINEEEKMAFYIGG
jgi:hypothetical protein